MDQRIYDLVLFGSSGYTGSYTAEHIVDTFPTTLSWAIAGRAHSKLTRQADELKSRSPDRHAPGVEVVQLIRSDLHALARKTKVILNCVGPYSLHGEPVIEACAANGTHYLDVTGETPWTRNMVKKYHASAAKTGAIIIPQCGVESAIADMMVYKLVKHVRTAMGSGTKEVVHSIHTMKSGLSGGTLASALGIFDVFNPLDVQKAMLPGSMISSAVPKHAHTPSIIARLTGVRVVPDLGTLAVSLPGDVDVPIVYHSWDIFKDTSEAYGSNFSFSPKIIVRNAFLATMIQAASMIAPLFLLFPPLRWILKKLVTQPGSGPDKEEAKSGFCEFRAVAFPDGSTRSKASGRMRFQGSLYYMTGILLSEAGAAILYGDDVPAKAIGGGVLTPATLGQSYIDRLEKGGIVYEARSLTQ